MTGRLLGIAVMSSVITLPCLAFAADIAATSNITAVTVFPAGAQVTRTTQVSLQPGEHSVILKDLPEYSLADSIRVEGLADGDLEIGSVDVKRVYIPWSDEQKKKKSARQDIEDKIQGLVDEKTALDGQLQALKIQTDYVGELSRLPAQPVRPLKDGEQGEAPNWSNLFDLIGSKMGELGKKTLAIKVEKRKLDKKIKELKEQLSQQPPKQSRRTQVRIIVKAEKDLKATLNVRYQIRRASWRPIYDARLVTKDGPAKARLSITRKAAISQYSGEAWDSVSLKLSTTAPNRRTAVPKLRPLKVYLSSPRRSKGYSNTNNLSFSGAQQESDAELERLYDKLPAKPGAAPKKKRAMQARRRQAKTKISSFQAVYEIPGKITIAPIGEAKTLTIGTVDVKPVLKAVSVPKIQKAAFLSANFKAPEGVQFIRGKVNLHRDGVYIGRGYMPDLAAGKDFDLGFGKDDAIHVTYAEVNRSKGATGLITSTRTDTRTFKITAKNFHGWSIPLTVMDQIPYSENEIVQVHMLPETSKPSRRNVDEKRGLLAWDFDLKKGEEKELNLSYKVNWPNGKGVKYRSTR